MVNVFRVLWAAALRTCHGPDVSPKGTPDCIHFIAPRAYRARPFLGGLVSRPSIPLDWRNGMDSRFLNTSEEPQWL